MHLNGENRKMPFDGRKLAKNEQMERRLMLLKIFKEVVCPYPEAIYIYMYIWPWSHDQYGRHGYK